MFLKKKNYDCYYLPLFCAYYLSIYTASPSCEYYVQYVMIDQAVWPAQLIGRQAGV